jgi:hypothetical protein
MGEPMTIEKARATHYGGYRNEPYREGFCVERVPDGGRSPLSHQCTRKNGHGPSGLYCRQHAKRFATDLASEEREA